MTGKDPAILPWPGGSCKDLKLAYRSQGGSLEEPPAAAAGKNGVGRDIIPPLASPPSGWGDSDLATVEYFYISN